MRYFISQFYSAIFGLQIAPLIGAGIISGLGSLLGGIFSGVSQASAQDSANNTNIMLNRENRDWMTHMSNTSVQRNVNDMRNAGINPLLAAGGGASSPSTSAAEVAASNPASGLGGIGSAVQTAMDVSRTESQLEINEKQGKVIDSTDQNVRHDSKKKISETQLNNAAQMTELERAKQVAASAQDLRLRNEFMRETFKDKVSKSRLEGSQAEYDQQMLKYDNLIKRARDAMDLTSSAATVASPIGRAVKTVKEAKSKAELMKELNNAYKRSGQR